MKLYVYFVYETERVRELSTTNSKFEKTKKNIKRMIYDSQM